MSGSWIKAWIVTSMLAASTAQGATLYQRDGITLEGTIQMVTRGAGVCQVLAERHPAEMYERIKANHGQPLHVWRMDFAARNGSGRKLEHLTAHFKIASEWPPCTNWTGPEGRYVQPVQWAGSFEVLQRPYGMEPGQLPPDIMADLHLRQAEQAARNGDATGARRKAPRAGRNWPAGRERSRGCGVATKASPPVSSGTASGTATGSGATRTGRRVPIPGSAVRSSDAAGRAPGGPCFDVP